MSAAILPHRSEGAEVVAHEQLVEPQELPGLLLVVGGLRDHVVDVANALNDFHPLDEGEDWQLPVYRLGDLVCTHSHDEVVAFLTRAPEEVDMAFVEEVEDPGRVPNNGWPRLRWGRATDSMGANTFWVRHLDYAP